MRIAIIGAGVCGLYLGWKLSEKGHKVVIFEKEKEVGNKVCSGLFSERILEFVPESKSLIENQLHSVYLHFPKKTVRVKFSKTFFAMDHSQLDKLLFELAKKDGAEVIFNSNISSLPQRFDKIIGCDGANSFVRRSLKLPAPVFRLGIQIFRDQKSSDDFAETWPCQKGFIWKVPRGEKTEYGIISEPKLARQIFTKFSEENRIDIKKIKSKIIAQGLVIPSNETITLCGDAAGLTKPWSGGGVVWGLTAAEILLKTFPDFLAYRKKAKRFFIPKILLSKTATKIVCFLGFKTPWLFPQRVKMESDFLF